MIAGLALRLFGMARSGASAGLSWITASSVHLLLAALGASLAWGYVGHHNAAKWKRVSVSMKAAYSMAQADATRAQDALNLAISARTRADTEKISAQHQIALGDAHSGVLAYARRMPAHACSEASGSSPAAVPDRAPVGTGASDPPGMAAVSVADLDILASNTVRAESCRALAQAWVEAGVAVVGD